MTPVGWVERYLRRVFRDVAGEQEWQEEEEEDGKDEGRLTAQAITHAVDASVPPNQEFSISSWPSFFQLYERIRYLRFKVHRYDECSAN